MFCVAIATNRLPVLCPYVFFTHIFVANVALDGVDRDFPAIRTHRKNLSVWLRFVFGEIKCPLAIWAVENNCSPLVILLPHKG